MEMEVPFFCLKLYIRYNILEHLCVILTKNIHRIVQIIH